ncbi:MAG: hypothetical protein AB1634_07565 [Thermodesulfobacteriota bacterium]
MAARNSDSRLAVPGRRPTGRGCAGVPGEGPCWRPLLASGSFLYPGRQLPWWWLLPLAALFLAVRIPLLDHPLTWDEAWNLAALRSLAGSGSLFLPQFFRHPPLYMELGFLLSPLADGFAERMAALSLAANLAGLLLLVLLVARFLGRPLALAAGLAWILLPASVFFDTWIKRDCLVIPLGLAALWLLLDRRPALAGVFAGFAFLAKETAIFIFAGLVLTRLVDRRRPGCALDLALLGGCALTVCGWWYLFLAEGGHGFWTFFQGTSEEARGFALPWWQYLAQLRLDLGWPGLFLLGLGLTALAWRPWPGRRRLLPILMLLPGYTVLSLSAGKPPWLVMVLVPWLAVLAGAGGLTLASTLSRLLPGRMPPRQVLAPLLVAVALGPPLLGFQYDRQLRALSPGQWALTEAGYAMAGAINTEVKDGETLLLMPMTFRSGADLLDPILFWRLQVRPRIIQGQGINTEEELLSVLRRNQVHWLLLAPKPGSPQEAMLRALLARVGPQGRVFSRGVLLRVTDLWQEEAPETAGPGQGGASGE